MVVKVPKKVDNFTKAVIILMVVVLIIVTTGVFYYITNNKLYTIDSSDSISEPHLNGSVTIEVDYMEYCEVTQSQLDEIAEIFRGYGVNVTLILDDEVSYQSELSDDAITIYYQQYRDRNMSSYILIGSEYNESDNVLGAIYNSEKIVIFKDSIDNSFDGAYRLTALYYVVAHEIGHAYGAEHSEQESDIMYPYLSQAKIILYPEPQFYDSDSVEEIRN